MWKPEGGYPNMSCPQRGGGGGRRHALPLVAATGAGGHGAPVAVLRHLQGVQVRVRPAALRLVLAE